MSGLAREAGIPDVQMITNGELLRLAPGPLEIIDDVPVGRRYRDGKIVIDEGEGSVRERRKLASVGLAAVALVLDQRGNVLGETDVALDGIPAQTAEGEAMEDVVLDAVDGTLDSIPARRRRDAEVVREAVRRAVRSAVDRAWGKKTIVKVLVTQLRTRG